MATLSPEVHDHVVDENTPPWEVDPFWQARPRVVSHEVEALLKVAAEQVVPLPPPVALHQGPNRQASHPVARRATCTHVVMGKLYGNHICEACNHLPSNGYLYQCQQDIAFQNMPPLSDSEPALTVPDDDNYFEAQAKVAEFLGMSISIIKQIRSETFGMDQIETLFAQRRNVLRVIKEAERSTAQSTPQLSTRFPSGPAVASDGVTVLPTVSLMDQANTLGISTVGTPVNTPSASLSTTPRKKKASQSMPRCALKVCHACRPFYRDRVPMSFGSIQHNEIPAVTDEEIAQRLPVYDPNVVRKIGLREPPTVAPAVQSPGNVPMHEGDGCVDNVSEDGTPTTTSYSEGLTDSADAADLYRCPGAGVCPLWSPSQGCAYDKGFDDGKRALNHSTVGDVYNYPQARDTLTATPGDTPSTSSSVSLPNPRTPPLTPVTPVRLSFGVTLPNNYGKRGKAGKAATVCGVGSDDAKTTSRFGGFGLMGKPSCSSLGSEVEVDGGVALKEEAVETGTPDIITNEQ